jgi:hypothetical protein
LSTQLRTDGLEASIPGSDAQTKNTVKGFVSAINRQIQQHFKLGVLRRYSYQKETGINWPIYIFGREVTEAAAQLNSVTSERAISGFTGQVVHSPHSKITIRKSPFKDQHHTIFPPDTVCSRSRTSLFLQRIVPEEKARALKMGGSKCAEF